MAFEDEVVDGLAAATAALPAGEERPGQVEMARAVANGIEHHRHVIVAAGTGTGKSLAYLVPSILSGKRVVIATATKALQDQLAGKDLPFLAEHLDEPFEFSVLKGRSNYLCLQRLDELTSASDQLELEGLGGARSTREIERLSAWAETTATGDRADLDEEPSVRVWAAVSVGPRECPGAAKCPKGGSCFAELARRRAAEADVVVVNTHLYGLHLASGAAVLPDHEVVILDEAHQIEETISATAGLELTPGRFPALGRVVGAIVADRELTGDLDAAGNRLATALGNHLGRRLRGALPDDLGDIIVLGRHRIDLVLSALRSIDDAAPGDVAARKQRAMKAATSLAEDLDAIMSVPPTHVAWIEGSEERPVLRVAPVDVAEVLRESLWDQVTAVLTSATIPPSIATTLGLEPGSFEQFDVGSPFDYERQCLLYCAAHLPDPRNDAFDPALHDELEALIRSAEGRTLALFTSYRALGAALDALRPRLPWPVLAPDDLPKPALIERFRAEPHTSLFATMGFWQGIDVPGPSLSLVTIDRLPFPRPDDPLLQARRERARADAFRTVDLPRAATLLAQGVGRLIRSTRDRGVVAVFDPRLATNTRYRWDLIGALPPMARTKDLADAERFLRALKDDAE